MKYEMHQVDKIEILLKRKRCLRHRAIEIKIQRVEKWSFNFLTTKKKKKKSVPYWQLPTAIACETLRI